MTEGVVTSDSLQPSTRMLRKCKRTRVKAPELNSSPSKSSLVPANTNDGLILKPAEGPNVGDLGRTKPDTDKDGQDKFVRRKVPFTISTFNTRTLNSPAKKKEIALLTRLCNMALTSNVCRSIELHRVMSFYKKVRIDIH